MIHIGTGLRIIPHNEGSFSCRWKFSFTLIMFFSLLSFNSIYQYNLIIDRYLAHDWIYAISAYERDQKFTLHTYISMYISIYDIHVCPLVQIYSVHNQSRTRTRSSIYISSSTYPWSTHTYRPVVLIIY